MSEHVCGLTGFRAGEDTCDACVEQGRVFRLPSSLAQERMEGTVVEYLYLGSTYETQEGKRVTMVSINNPGTRYETLVDNHGVNRYSRRVGDVGRVTGTAHDHSDPKNIKRPFACLAPTDAAAIRSLIEEKQT